MCSPALAITGIGTAISAFGTLQAGSAQKSQYEYQAKQANIDARNEASAAKVRADKIRKAAIQEQGAARANLAASGVDVNAGTSVEINRKIGQNSEEDALVEILNGDTSASRLRDQARNYKTAGKNASQASFLSAGSTLIEGGSKVYNGWRTAKGAQQ